MGGKFTTMTHAAVAVALTMEVPDNEDERLRELHDLGILDTPKELAFDNLTELAAKYFRAPIALVSLVDSDRVWFKSTHGLADIRQIDRGPGLCASAIMQDEAYVCSNLLEDPYSVNNPLVSGEAGLRFYAAAPLRTKNGHNLGTFCVLDTVPRNFSAEESRDLKLFSELAIAQMDRLTQRRGVGGQVASVIAELSASLK